jgi:hypothetical protein
LTVYGSNFTKNTRIYVNGQKVSTTYLTSALLSTRLDNVSDGDVITVNTLGSKGILLRAGTGEVVYEDPDILTDTEEPTEKPTDADMNQNVDSNSDSDADADTMHTSGSALDTDDDSDN